MMSMFLLDFLSSSSSDEETITTFIIDSERKKIPKIQNFIQIVHQMDNREFRRNFRMNKDTAYCLIDKYGATDFFTGKGTWLRGKLICSPEKRILLFLWFAANKCCLRDVAQRFGVSLSSAWRIVDAVTDYLLTIAPKLIKFPHTPQEKELMTAEFEKLQPIPFTESSICNKVTDECLDNTPEDNLEEIEISNLNTPNIPCAELFICNNIHNFTDGGCSNPNNGGTSNTNTALLTDQYQEKIYCNGYSELLNEALENNIIFATPPVVSGFPGCLGCIDGTSINIITPAKKIKATYVNRHDIPALTLQAICGPDKLFTDVFTGVPGKIHDSRVFKLSDIYQTLPQICGKNYHLLGDSAYHIREWCLTPYREYGNLTESQRLFNKTFCATRVLIENSFGLLKSRFRQLLLVHMHDVDKISKFIIACCILHNFCVLNNDIIDETESLDINFNNINDQTEQDSENRLRRLGEIKRNSIKDQFMARR